MKNARNSAWWERRFNSCVRGMARPLMVVAVLYTASPVGAAAGSAVCTVRPFDHQQVYLTGAAGFTWYWNHLNNAPNKSEVFQWLFKDLNIEYIRTGFQVAETNNDNADPLVIDWSGFNFASPGQGNQWVYKQASLINTNMKTLTYAHGFPDWMRVAPGGHGAAPDYSNTNIYAEIAEWMFANLVNLKQNEHIVCDILDIYNEPDDNGFGRDNTANLLEHVVPLLRGWVADTNRNSYGVTMPQIMASSCMRASGSRSYLTYWHDNQPAVWTNIDIVSTHQYYSGAYVATNYSDVNAIRGGRPYMESEMDTLEPEGHLNDPNELPEDWVEDQLEAALLQGRAFCIAANNGVSVYDHYQGVSPQTNPASLIFTPWQKPATRRKVYFAYQQLTSMQTYHSAVVPTQITNGAPGCCSVAYHKWGENKTWLSFVNPQDTNQNVVLRVLDHNQQPIPITAIREFETSASNNATLVLQQNFVAPVSEFQLMVSNHCVKTFEITWVGENQLVASDDFESGGSSGGTGWTGNWSRTGSPYPLPASYNKNFAMRFVGTSGLTNAITRTLGRGVHGGVLRFLWDVDSLETSDVARAEVFDGSWHTVWTATAADNGSDSIPNSAANYGDNFQRANISLDSFGTVTQVRFSLAGDSGWDFFFLDEVEIAAISPVASYATNLTANLTHNLLTLSWPGTHLGWILQSQTNSRSGGLGTNWTDVSGSATVNSATNTINAGNASAFYRLRSP